MHEILLLNLAHTCNIVMWLVYTFLSVGDLLDLILILNIRTIGPYCGRVKQMNYRNSGVTYYNNVLLY